MTGFQRFRYQPVVPLGKDGRKVTASKAHLAVSKEAAVEGTVLLKNDGVLPLKKGQKVCLFGRGAGEFVFGGGGSGNVLSDIRISLADALIEADRAGKISLFTPLIDQAKASSEKAMREIESAAKGNRGVRTYRSFAPLPIPDCLYREAVNFGGIAVLSILRYSSEGTMDGDRKTGAGGFALYPEEEALLEKLGRDFESVVVVLTVCGPIATEGFLKHPKVGAVLYPLYGGSFAGRAITEILLGERYPSGHLQDTFPRSISDYPSTETYFESDTFVRYEEDIFVGYRYFETFCPEKVVFPFGFGLSYTTFDIKAEKAAFEKNTVSLSVRVKNTGAFAGKEVVQVYLSAPQGVLGKAKKVLTAFAKTKELLPDQEQVLSLSFDLRAFASFDDLGKIKKSAFVLEKGEYQVLLGTNVRDTEKVLSFSLPETIVTKNCGDFLAPKDLPFRLTASGKPEALPASDKALARAKGLRLKENENECTLTLEQALDQGKMKEFVASLTDRELGDLLYGHPAICAAGTGYIGHQPNTRGRYGNVNPKMVPPVPTADGPAGLRTTDQSGVYTTYFPAGNTLSQTWNLSLVARVGKTAARELKENNCGIWLAPGMNIHRSPLCGRNFEYYSEDPLATGLIASAMVKGIQSQNIAATVKHFACNNKEINRKCSDSRVSQRALREIYLRGFEIVVKKANPWCIMSSYNLINGTHASANGDLLTGILKGEWNFKGLVMTDWWTYESFESEFYAGSDVKMPHCINLEMPNPPEDRDIGEMIADGTLSRPIARAAAMRILTVLGHLR